jgi:peptide/nickel transport system permease protein
VTLVIFALPARLPGGAESGFLGPHTADPSARASLRRDLHLGDSLPVQYAHFLGDAVRGDLGYSPVSGVDVGAVVGERLVESLGLASAAGIVAFLVSLRRRRRRRGRAPRGQETPGAAVRPGESPPPSAVPGSVWALPLFAAVAVAARLGFVPAPAPHAAVVSRLGAGLLPAAALGLGLAAWTRIVRRRVRDVVAALLVGTIVTESVFGLPGLGSLITDAASRHDALTLRGALLVLSCVAVVAAVVFVPVGGAAGGLSGGPSNLRRAAGGTVAIMWVLALVAATIARAHLGLEPAGRIGNRVGEGLSLAHPFGTDALGRDVLARVLATARGSLLLVVAAMLLATIAGTVIGAVIGFAGGRLERVGLALLAGWAAFPGELLALALLAFNGRDGKRAAIALAVVAAPSIAFGAQRRTLDALRRSDARLGSGAWLRNVGSRATPGLLRALLATMFVGASRVVVAEMVAGLLGLGPAATQTWSHEIATQLAFAARAPWAVIAPVSVGLVTAVAFAGLGNAIRPSRRGPAPVADVADSAAG